MIANKIYIILTKIIAFLSEFCENQKSTIFDYMAVTARAIVLILPCFA
jgi:hypothetical protein